MDIIVLDLQKSDELEKLVCNSKEHVRLYAIGKDIAVLSALRNVLRCNILSHVELYVYESASSLPSLRNAVVIR